jgi:hypothetical protein
LLFNLATDPNETANVVAQHPKKAKELAKQLETIKGAPAKPPKPNARTWPATIKRPISPMGNPPALPERLPQFDSSGSVGRGEEILGGLWTDARVGRSSGNEEIQGDDGLEP